MIQTFFWHATFIDCKFESESDCTRRAHSAPAWRTCRPLADTLFAKERDYVKVLSEKSNGAGAATNLLSSHGERSHSALISFGSTSGSDDANSYAVESLVSLYQSQERLSESIVSRTKENTPHQGHDGQDFVSIRSWRGEDGGDPSLAVQSAAAEAAQETLLASAGDAQESCAANPGSHGHPYLCKGPCSLFAKGFCKWGSDCMFCHLDGHSGYEHLSKRNRTTVEGLGYSEYVKMIMRPLERKAKELNVHDILGEVLCITEFSRSYKESGRQIRELKNALNRMSIIKLMQMIPAHPGAPASLKAEVEEAVEKLRYAGIGAP